MKVVLPCITARVQTLKISRPACPLLISGPLAAEGGVVTVWAPCTLASACPPPISLAARSIHLGSGCRVVGALEKRVFAASEVGCWFSGNFYRLRIRVVCEPECGSKLSCALLLLVNNIIQMEIAHLQEFTPEFGKTASKKKAEDQDVVAARRSNKKSKVCAMSSCTHSQNEHSYAPPRTVMSVIVTTDLRRGWWLPRRCSGLLKTMDFQRRWASES